MPPAKRRLGVIDLTDAEDDDVVFVRDGPNNKRVALSASQTDATEVFDLTQDDDGPERELYTTHGQTFLESTLAAAVMLTRPPDNKIVGTRYYLGYANPGEVVLCCREPNNPVSSPLSETFACCDPVLIEICSMIRMLSK